MAEMVYTKYRLLGAQLQAGRMLAAVKTSRCLTDLIDSPQALATPMDSPYRRHGHPSGWQARSLLQRRWREGLPQVRRGRGKRPKKVRPGCFRAVRPRFSQAPDTTA